MNSRIRSLIRKLISEASKTEENEYYIDTELINEIVEDKKNESKKVAPTIKKNIHVKN